MYRIALVAQLAHSMFAPSDARPHRPHARPLASLRPVPETRPLTGVRKARRADRGLARPTARALPSS